MVKCVDCNKHVAARNFCQELKAALTFSPDSETICDKFEPKTEEKAEKKPQVAG